MPKKFAAVAWTAADVQELKPSWSLEECKVWLEDNAKYIQEALVQKGNEVIEDLLPEVNEQEVITLYKVEKDGRLAVGPRTPAEIEAISHNAGPDLPGIHWEIITDPNWNGHETFAIGKAIADPDADFHIGYEAIVPGTHKVKYVLLIEGACHSSDSNHNLAGQEI